MLAALLISCAHDPGPGGGPGDSGAPATAPEGWCGIRLLFDSDCKSCHYGVTASARLDLVTDPWPQLVNVPSTNYGYDRVVPGDPDDSFLYRKLAGTVTPDEGDSMPPGRPLSADDIEIVHDWIADGAPEEECPGG